MASPKDHRNAYQNWAEREPDPLVQLSDRQVGTSDRLLWFWRKRFPEYGDRVPTEYELRQYLVAEHDFLPSEAEKVPLATILLQEERVKPAQVVCLGDGRYQAGEQCIQLSDSEAAVLDDLVGLRAASKDDLAKNSGSNDAPRILKRIQVKYPILGKHINLPGGKGRGGYSTTIIDGRG